MSRAFDFTVIGVIISVAVVVHLIGVNLFIPGTPLYEIATDGTEAMNGQQRADMWAQALVIWVPLLSSGGIISWGFIREYRRQATTAARSVARP